MLGDETWIASIRAQEEEAFTTNKEAAERHAAAVQKTKSVLEQEIASLRAKDVAQTDLLNSVKKERDEVATLVGRGLALSARLLTLERNYAEIQSLRIDIQTAILRAQQEIARYDQHLIEVKDTRRSTILNDLNGANARIAELEYKRGTNRSLARVAKSALMFSTPTEVEPGVSEFTVMRRDGDSTRTLRVSGTDTLEPGDTLRVDLQASRNDVSSALRPRAELEAR
jgi:hypothetical protein